MATPTDRLYLFHSRIDRKGFPDRKLFESEEQLVRFLERIHQAALKDECCVISPEEDKVTVLYTWKGVDPTDDERSLIGVADALTVLDAKEVPEHEILDPMLTKEEQLRRFGQSHAKQVRRNLEYEFDGDYDREDVSLLLEAFCDELSE